MEDFGGLAIEDAGAADDDGKANGCLLPLLSSKSPYPFNAFYSVYFNRHRWNRILCVSMKYSVNLPKREL